MDILNFMLWIYKILPFILVSYFIISSFLGNDFSGFLVFLGILLSSFVTFIVGEIPAIREMLERSIGEPGNINYVNKINEYKILKFGDSGNPYTLFPLGTNTFSFILGYFLMVLSMSSSKRGGNTFKPFRENWILISVLSALLAFDVSTNFKYIGGLVIFPVAIGMIMGVIWAIMIGKKNHMVPKKENKKCGMDTTKKYRCVLNKNGTLLK